MAIGAMLFFGGEMVIKELMGKDVSPLKQEGRKELYEKATTSG